MALDDSYFEDAEKGLDSKFLSWNSGDSTVVLFLVGNNTLDGKKRVRHQVDEFKGKPTERTHFEGFTIEQFKEGSIDERHVKHMNQGKRFSRPVLAHLKRGKRLLQIDCIGEGTNKNFTVTEVTNPQYVAMIEKYRKRLDTLQETFDSGESDENSAEGAA